jgi:hypothetical protein
VQEITLGKVRAEEKSAYKKYMLAFKRNNSKEARDTFLDELVAAIAEEGGVKHESVVKSLKTREHIQRTH